MNRREMITLTTAGAALRFASARNALGAPVPPAASGSPSPGDATPDTLLVKDYRPNSIFKVPQTHIEKCKYPLIDFHAGGVGDTTDQGRVDELVKVMDSLGIGKVVVTGDKTPTPEKFQAVRKLYSNHPDRFILFCTFDLSSVNEPDFAAKSTKALEECHRLGAVGAGEMIDKGKGLGFQVNGPDEPGYYTNIPNAPHPDDERMDPLWDKCGQLGMPVLIHFADPIWGYEPMDKTNDGLPNSYVWSVDEKQPGIRGFDSLIEALETIAQKHPKTIFVAAHIADLYYDPDRLSKLLDQHPNIYGETAARFHELSTIPRAMNKFLQKYPDRVLYGTDWDFYNPDFMRATFRVLETRDEHFYSEAFRYYRWPMYGLGLPDPVLKKVYRDNALEVFRKARNA